MRTAPNSDHTRSTNILLGWIIPLLVGAVITLGLSFTLTPGLGGLITLSVTIISLILLWLLLARFITRSPTSRWLILLWVSLPLAGFLATFANPTGATLQVTLYPLCWVLANNLRQALSLNLLVAVAVTLGFGMGLGNEWWLYGAVVAAASVLFSLVIGLWVARIERWGAERAALLEQLQESQEVLNQLHHHNGAVAERERLAQEIHDTIAQSLTAVVILTQRMKRDIDSQPELADQLSTIEELSQTALKETRTLVATNASLPATESLPSAITSVAQRFALESKIEMSIKLDVASGELSRELEVVVLRCVQEGVANIRKHAPNATAASIQLTKSNSRITLLISDNGSSEINALDQSNNFGLAGLRTRIMAWDGSLTLGREKEVTTLRIKLKLNEAES